MSINSVGGPDRIFHTEGPETSTDFYETVGLGCCHSRFFFCLSVYPISTVALLLLLLHPPGVHPVPPRAGLSISAQPAFVLNFKVSKVSLVSCHKAYGCGFSLPSPSVINSSHIRCFLKKCSRDFRKQMTGVSWDDQLLFERKKMIQYCIRIVAYVPDWLNKCS